jgi:hypothetical protein
MDNTLKKAESIGKTVETYETDSILGMRGAATIYRYSYQSAPNIFISQQKIWPVEESVLVEYCIRNFKEDFPLII